MSREFKIFLTGPIGYISRDNKNNVTDKRLTIYGTVFINLLTCVQCLHKC